MGNRVERVRREGPGESSFRFGLGNLLFFDDGCFDRCVREWGFAFLRRQVILWKTEAEEGDEGEGRDCAGGFAAEESPTSGSDERFECEKEDRNAERPLETFDSRALEL